MGNELKSGKWKGFYIYGKDASSPSHIMNMDVTIEDNVIIIKGADDVGAFVCKGIIDYDTKICFFFKRYSTHEVYYKGAISNEGIAGTWKLNNRLGIFFIWPFQESLGMKQLKERMTMKRTSKSIVRRVAKKGELYLYN